MYNKKIKDSKSATHLGIVRNVNGKPDIEEKIKLDRKTAYSLMGTGFNGGGGSNHLIKRVYMVNFCGTKAAVWDGINIA